MRKYLTVMLTIFIGVMKNILELEKKSTNFPITPRNIQGVKKFKDIASKTF